MTASGTGGPAEDAQMRPTCHYCESREREMRPYGPGGSWVCHPCATATPEREAQAHGAFSALLDGSEAISPSGITAIGEQSGPRPFDPREMGDKP